MGDLVFRLAYVFVPLVTKPHPRSDPSDCRQGQNLGANGCPAVAANGQRRKTNAERCIRDRTDACRRYGSRRACDAHVVGREGYRIDDFVEGDVDVIENIVTDLLGCVE